MSGRRPDSDVGVPVLRQAWRSVTFVHLPYDPDEVQRLLPEGLTVDVFGDSAWVSLTPLVMAEVRPAPLPAAVSLPSFPETNLRTYVRGPGGADGLWFFSLDVTSAAFAAAARALLGAPYAAADLEVDVRADGQPGAGLVTYRGRRGDEAAYEIALRPGAPLTPEPLDDWLTGRWRAYTCHAGVLLETPVAHEPWPLRAAEVVACEETLTGAAGLPRTLAAPRVHYSDGVEEVGFGASRPVG